MQNCLGSQIGRNIQVYIDDVVITTRKEESLISDLKETFDNLDRYKLKLNPTKMFFWCFSRTTSGIPGISKRNRSKPRENPGNINNGKTSKITRGATTRGTRSSTKSIHRTARRKGSPILRTHEKVT
jgi:hypothetical protein